ncbi:MAG: zinc-binding dehydrogenase [Ferruginibacter sp.]
MKAIMLIKTGNADKAFEMREVPKPSPQDDEVLIKTEVFGLNFADVVARRGMYKEAPPIPFVPGYDVAGIVEETGKDVTNVQKGDRVMAMTRFGGYSEYAVTKATAVAKIPGNMDAAVATALTTQYCTAYFSAAEMVNLYKGDKVLIHAGAGGVGTALIQYAAYKECEIFTTAGSKEKFKHIISLGVHHPINYKIKDFETEVKNITGGKGVDVIFDAIGGKSVKKGMHLLAPGGRLICYGASGMNDKNIFGKIKDAIGFGFYHPIMFMMPSKSMIGVNMLKIADHKPKVLQRCLENVVKLADEGVFKPTVSKIFDVSEIAAAHDYLEKRNSIGKVAVKW